MTELKKENNILLEVSKLTVSIHSETGPEQILDAVSFSIARGETVALVGESGSGKSVTALTIMRLLETSASVTNKGSILFDGQELLSAGEATMRSLRGNRIAMIFQEPMTSMNPVYSIGDQLMESLIVHQGMSKKDAADKAVSLLERTGIPDPATRIKDFPHQLSGGQRQRVMIAMALACRPALLIADEPTTALDVTIQAQILELIRDIQQELDMAVLLITHDLTMVRKIADRVNIMHEGRIVEHGPTSELFATPRDPYTIHLLQSVPKGIPAPKTASAPLFSIQNLYCHFPVRTGFFKRQVGVIRAVDGVSLDIRRGTTYGVVGESGSGKSTLGMCLLRLTGSMGSIQYVGQQGKEARNLNSLRSKEMRPLRKELQIVFQDPFSSLSPRLTVEEIVAEGLKVHGIGGSRAERRDLVARTLHEVGLEAEMADRYPHEFSGGQRQRIAIARAVVLKPRFMVLDEPTSALDMTIQAQIIDLLKALQHSHNMTYLFISHDLRVIKSMCDEVAVMQNGKIVESGPAGQLFADPRHPYTQALFAAAFDLESRVMASSRESL